MALYYESPLDVSTKQGYRDALDRYGFGKSMRSHAADRLATADFGRQLDRIAFMGNVVEPTRQSAFQRASQMASTDFRQGAAKRQGGSILQRVLEQNQQRQQMLSRQGLDQRSIAGLNAQAEMQGQQSANLFEQMAVSPEQQANVIAALIALSQQFGAQDNPIYQQQQMFQEGRNDQRDAKNSSMFSGLFGTAGSLIPLIPGVKK